MTNNKQDRYFGGQTSGTPVQPVETRRPYATLDLKSTEIKITPVPDNAQSYRATATRGTPVTKPDELSKSANTTKNANLEYAVDPRAVPLPAAASRLT